MTKINIGFAGKRKIDLDLEVLLRTRLLIQANSGGGKSYLLRRICEQAFGKVQIIIIDPEGEFATLREKYDFVLVGHGGETPADVRSAALVAHKLLELNASAVCDLYEMKVGQRHQWVSIFLEALLDAPKELWHSLLVVVDEAHVYCPEKGAGESVASEAMIGLATRGRKRGFCAVFATQRLGKLRKDAAAELLNILVGQTFIDVDRKRAADALGIPKSDERVFFNDMKVIEPGHFWALGRAVTKERLLVEIGPAQTTHPEPGKAGQSYEPPPAPEKIKAMLLKLADLPQTAEKKARTEDELRTEIRSLTAKLAARPTLTVPEIQRVEVPVFQNGELERMQEIAGQFGNLGEQLATLSRDLLTTAKTKLSSPARLSLSISDVPADIFRPANRRFSQPPRKASLPTGVEGITGPEQRILDAIGWFSSIGQTAPKQTGVAFLAGYTYGGGAFNNPRGRLRSKELVTYVGGDCISLTPEGIALARWPVVPLTTEEMQSRVFSVLPRPETHILQALIGQYPNSISKAALSALTSRRGGAFNNPLGRLRTLGLIEYPQPGYARALPILFLE